MAGIGKTKSSFWVMIAAGIFVVIFVPMVASSSPVLAVWIYTGGWAVSALTMIGFYYYEKFALNWWKAYGEPLLPTLVMLAILEAGRFAKSWFHLFVCVGLLALISITISIEKNPKPKSNAAQGARPLL